MSLSQKQRDEVVQAINTIGANVTVLDVWIVLDLIAPYLGREDFLHIRGELCSDKDMMDAYR